MENIKDYFPPIETYIAVLPAKRKASEMEPGEEEMETRQRKRPEPRVMNDALLTRIDSNTVVTNKKEEETAPIFKPTKAFYGIVLLIGSLLVISFNSNVYNFIKNLFTFNNPSTLIV